MTYTTSASIVVEDHEWVLYRTGFANYDYTVSTAFTTSSATNTVSGPDSSSYVGMAFTLSDTGYFDAFQTTVTMSLTGNYSLSHQIYDPRVCTSPIASASLYLPAVAPGAFILNCALSNKVMLEANRRYYWVFRSNNDIPGTFAFYLTNPPSTGSAGEVLSGSALGVCDAVAHAGTSTKSLYMKTTASLPSDKAWLPFAIDRMNVNIRNKIGISELPYATSSGGGEPLPSFLVTYPYRGTTSSFYQREVTVDFHVFNRMGYWDAESHLRRMADRRTALQLESRWNTYSSVILQGWSINPKADDRMVAGSMRLIIRDK